MLLSSYRVTRRPWALGRSASCHRICNETNAIDGQSRYVDWCLLLQRGPKLSSVLLYCQLFSSYGQFHSWRRQRRWRLHGETNKFKTVKVGRYLLLSRGPTFVSVSLYSQPFSSSGQFQLWRRQRRWRHNSKTKIGNIQSRYVDRHLLRPNLRPFHSTVSPFRLTINFMFPIISQCQI